ncbi:MAG: ABC transporter substrate-binding protein [Chitinophagales bacterium]
MKIHTNKTLLALCCVVSFMFAACSGSKSDGPTTSTKLDDPSVTMHELTDCDKLNPVLSSSANSTYVEGNIFWGLLTTNFKTLEFEGQLAVSRPEIKNVTEGEYAGGMSLTYEIRPEATWDNGKPILASDYVFTMKIIKNPKVQAANIRPYMEFIDDVKIDANNPKKFTVFAKKPYFLAEAFSGYTIYPEYVYDPKGLMKDFKLKELNDTKNKDKFLNNPKIQEFAKEFNSSKFAREKGFVVGSGPYEFTEWETGQQIVLTKKKNWWGDKVPALKVNPTKIVYKVRTDWTATVSEMKSEKIDLSRSMRPSDFVDLKKNKLFNSLFNLHSPVHLAYDYIGFNRKNPRLEDKRVRRAIAHLVNTNEIIDVLLYGLGEPVTGPIHPSKSYYNKNLKRINYDVEKAVGLLKEAGWEDTDNNGIVDKIVDGKKMEMKLKYTTNAGREHRKNIGILLKENAKRAGIEIEVEILEWTVFLEKNKRREFDLKCLGWVQSPMPDDMKQIWHTSSDSPDGSNQVGFGNEESDRIIDKIRETIDEGERAKLYMRIQELIYEDQPYVFLMSPRERIAIHNRFDNADTYVARPGYDESKFALKQSAE